MKISTRTRYGTRLMLNLALGYGRGPILLKDIAKREDISEKYLSQIVIPLKAQGLVNSFRGAHGGYTLAKHPSQTTAREIIEILEGGLILVDGVNGTNFRKKVSVSVTHEIWERIQGSIAETLNSLTLQDLIERYNEKDSKQSLMYNI